MTWLRKRESTSFVVVVHSRALGLPEDRVRNVVVEQAGVPELPRAPLVVATNLVIFVDLGRCLRIQVVMYIPQASCVEP